ncbi:unnamed protein product [Penicillium manginii]
MRRNKTVPCQECRNRHVKCDGQKPKCQRCEKNGSSCLWQGSPSGFRHGSSASSRYDFADDQPWLPIGQCVLIPLCQQIPEMLHHSRISGSGIADYSC